MPTRTNRPGGIHPHQQVASPLRPDHLCYLPLSTRGALQHETTKTRPTLSLGFHFPASGGRQTTQRYLVHKDDGYNLRSAIEATVRSVKHSFPAGELPVRDRFWVTCMMIRSALVSNVRRIQRYLEPTRKPDNEPTNAVKEQESSQEQSPASFFYFNKCYFLRLDDAFNASNGRI